MLMLGPIGFAAPWVLSGLLILPVLWLLLRVMPPSPVRRRFPGVALLLGLQDDDADTDKTPWWLLLLRTLAAAAIIIGFAGPILHPQERRDGDGPLLVLVDATWADARDWDRRIGQIRSLLTEAGRRGRPVTLVSTTELPAEMPEFLAADVWQRRLAGLQPQPWQPDAEALTVFAAAVPEGTDTYWLSDGVARPGRMEAADMLQSRGTLTVFESGTPVFGLEPAVFDGRSIELGALRSDDTGAAEVTVSARGLDPTGVERELARLDLGFEAGSTRAQARLSLPAELRHRVTRFEIEGVRSAGAVTLTGDALQRREVALIAGREDREGLEVLSPLLYLEKALQPTADLVEGSLVDVLLASPDVIILTDVATLSPVEEQGLIDWVEEGGLLVRFAGNRLAASDVSRDTEDPLMPVRLRSGGRTIGGAMAWGEPKRLQPFTEESPFYGLPIPDDVQVNAQVLAQPDPDLSGRVIAALTDNTPLVTRKQMGQGGIVLFHVTANAEWSSLPLSGLFVQMLERLSISTRPDAPSAEELAGTTWQADRLLDGFGNLHDAGTRAGIDGKQLAEAVPGPRLPPGLYSDEDRQFVLNTLGPDAKLAPTVWPDDIPVEGVALARERLLKGALLALALALLATDIIASLALSGRIGLRRAGGAAVVLLAVVLASQHASAQETDDAAAIAATSEVRLAYVVTGDPALDEVTEAGLSGLSRVLFNRTTIEPAEPVAVDLERDELSFYPILYWAVSPDQPIPSAEAYARLNRYLRTGGMILFDTRDGDIATAGNTTAEGRRLQQLAQELDIPPLEHLPPDHVLTRSFYLLQDFPGRYQGRSMWVEAAPADAVQAEGMPFRDLNDGVTPVVIGGNDWAAAWAIDERGMPRFSVGSGWTGERQREMAYRFGVNLVMHVLTGNYKSDQVHVPALLDRLGQ
ncbi:DUF4159 domain-containing protein [Qingshengfaniella alkalisoli]|uniref:DUF4159 domain-containing protein n=1 Tax=Qingshengfaniella alkalisoli TaxID=2599296 RepID=A0A5B8IXQ6_9RHOB|nr:DUF4159 domain-containing protein [Qingshengfaniella alkalisoli]QDY69721.1 DUF4159 domain-containing protein [Qingshengfaniella alkalisoli]